MIVYVVENLINGKKYVGSTTLGLASRKRAHLNGYHKNHKAIYDDVVKYGKDAFSFSVIVSCASYEEMQKQEMIWINKLDTVRSGYNKIVSSQGKKPHIFSETMRRIRTGSNHTKKTKDKISKTKTGVSIWPNGRPKTLMNKIIKASSEVRSIRIKCLNNGKIYKNAGEAAEDLGLKRTSIYSVVNGSRNSCYGYKFIAA